MAVKYGGLLKFTDEIKAEIDLAADGTVEKAVLIDGDGVETPIGGSSDLATAKVKVINNTGSIQGFVCPNIYTDGSTEGLIMDGSIGKNTETTITAVLYKGEAELFLDSQGVSITATGNIEISDSSAFISGDGTITISAS